MVFFAFLPLILLIIVVWGLKQRVASKINMNKKWTYLFLAAYIGILLIATVTSTLLNNSYGEQPKRMIEEEIIIIEDALNKGTLATVAPSHVLAQRTHKIGEVLSISTIAEETYPTITIERKTVNDGLIEETIFKPLLVIDHYDLSDQPEYVLPKWKNDELVFLTPPLSSATLTSYDDAFLLKQFTSSSRDLFAYSHTSTLREIAVHLVVPKDLIIEADEWLYVDYVNE